MSVVEICQVGPLFLFHFAQGYKLQMVSKAIKPGIKIFHFWSSYRCKTFLGYQYNGTEYQVNMWR